MHTMLRWHQTPWSDNRRRLLAGGKLLQLAVAQAEDTAAARGEVEIVGDENAGQLVFGVQSLDEGEDGLGGFAVEVAGWFVGEEKPGAGDEGAGEADALLLSAAEFAGAMLGAGGEADLVEPEAGLLKSFGATEAAS